MKVCVVRRGTLQISGLPGLQRKERGEAEQVKDGETVCASACVYTRACAHGSVNRGKLFVGDEIL